MKPKLYERVYEEKNGMSVVRFQNPNNQKAEVFNYIEEIRYGGDPIGVKFTIDGTTYFKLENDYNSTSRHVNLVMNDDQVIKICDAIAQTGLPFNYT